MACTRCRRPVLVPVIVDGKGYGKSCATKVGDLLVQPQRRVVGAKRRKKSDARQPALFTEANP